VLNFLKITDMSVEAYNQILTSKVDLATNVGFKVGGGMVINDKTLISVNYFGLGQHDIKVEMKGVGSSEDIEEVQTVDILTVTLGLKF